MWTFIIILIFVIVIGLGLFKINKRELITSRIVNQAIKNTKNTKTTTFPSTLSEASAASMASAVPATPASNSQTIIKPKNSSRVTFNPKVVKRYVDVDLPVGLTSTTDGIISEKTLKLTV